MLSNDSPCSRPVQIRQSEVLGPSSSLAALDHPLVTGKVTPLEAEKWANNPSAFMEEMQHV